MLNGLHPIAFIGPGGPEILVVMLVLLLMFGARDAPRIFRKLNDMLIHFRSTAESFKREVMYGDLSGHAPPDRTAGEYDEYGVGSQNSADDHVEAPDGAVPAGDRRSGTAAGSGVMPEGGEGEGADVQKH